MLYILLYFLLSLWQHFSLMSGEECNGQCITYDLMHEMKNTRLEDHVLQTSTVALGVRECLQMCVLECRCASINFATPLCELNSEDNKTQPQSLVNKTDYTYYSVKIAQVKQESTDCDLEPCENWCCLSKPCKNGGSCTELCGHRNKQMQCSCSPGWTGNLCQIRALSCVDYMRYNSNISSGMYTIYDSSSSDFYSVYCQMDNSKGWAWTVVLSYALGNNTYYNTKDLSLDEARYENSFNWIDYRLSFTRMTQLKDRSTHWRATCSYNEYGFDGRDYVQTRFDDFDVLVENAGKCHGFDFMNIKGKDCFKHQACTTWVVQGDSGNMFRISPQTGKAQPSNMCTFDIPNPMSTYEQIFGFYNVNGRSPDIRCTMNDQSTTNWWFGTSV